MLIHKTPRHFSCARDGVRNVDTLLIVICHLSLSFPHPICHYGGLVKPKLCNEVVKAML